MYARIWRLDLVREEDVLPFALTRKEDDIGGHHRQCTGNERLEDLQSDGLWVRREG